MSIYSERIIPEETSGGPLASHLKRYDFARQFCMNKTVLDAACGVGYGSYFLSKEAKEISGVDICEEAITYAKLHYQRDNMVFKVMDIHSLDFPDGYFDMACSFETLEHLEKPEDFLAEIRRVLKDEGRLIISTLQARRDKKNPENPYHRAEYSLESFEKLLRKYFARVEFFGQRRKQTFLHYCLQKLDVFHLRALLTARMRRYICHAAATRSWDEAGLEDFVITQERIKQAAELIGVCHVSRHG